MNLGTPPTFQAFSEIAIGLGTADEEDEAFKLHIVEMRAEDPRVADIVVYPFHDIEVSEEVVILSVAVGEAFVAEISGSPGSIQNI